MIRKYLNMFLSKNAVRYSSLFINGAKATEHFAYVSPYIDYIERKQNEEIEGQLLRRKKSIDLNKINNLWEVYEELKHCKTQLQNKKSEISKELGKLMKSDPTSDEIKKLKIHNDLLKENIKKLKVPLWSAEEAAILEVLKLPNIIHSKTPDRENNILFEQLSRPTSNKDHLTIGRQLNIINFKKNENYYLLGDAAIFELGAKFFFSKILKQNSFVQFSNPDFVKSLIIEGCGENHTNPDSTFILHHNEDDKVNSDSRLHLTGGGSLFSFFAYHAKNVLYPKVLPLKYFTMGRQYVPSPSDEDSLFHVSQSSVIQVFGATKSAEAVDSLLTELTEILQHAYSQLNCHFRMSLVPANKLFMWESLRLIVEMYSPSLHNYVEIANVSVSGDFISKRLMFTYIDNKESKFPHVISGTILNIPRFLGCFLEQDHDFVLPKLFRVENWM